MFLSYLLQNRTDFDKIWYMVSYINLSHRSVNIFHLTRIMSLHYLVKPSIRVMQVNGRTEKTHQMFLSYLLQNEADFDNDW